MEEKRAEAPTKRLAVIRIRGSVGVRKNIKETMQFLRLHKKNHLVFIDDRESYRGMLQKAKDYISWGELGAETIALLLKKRGRLRGNIKLTDALVKKYTKYETIDDFAQALATLEVNLTDFDKIKPVFRLTPPKGGFKRTIKRSVHDQGELGFRKDKEI